MHLSLLLLATGIALFVRSTWLQQSGTWAERWQRAFSAFLFPPLLLLITSLTVLGMGHHGTMLWQPVGWLGCHLALGFVALTGIVLVYLLGQQWRSVQTVRSLPITQVADTTSRLLETPALFAAQVGIWKPELILSQGLLQTLDPEQLEAVLSHEAAHHYYQDPFWFFGLNWIRRCTSWLPQTEALWQELLLLREIRADLWAAQHVEALVLAESLLLVVRSSYDSPQLQGAAFHDATAPHRLEERIEFLITQPTLEQVRGQSWIWLLATVLPLLTMLLHD